MNKKFRTYIIFWFGQSVSQLGSAMTSFALVIWAYTKTDSEMAVSLLAFCSYLPYIFVSLFAGGVIDNHSKKKIMLLSDLLAACCSVAVLLLWKAGGLQIWHIYIVNAVIGCMNAFQSPAESVAMYKLVPEEKVAQASGLDSLSGNLVTVVSPMAAAALFAFSGMYTVILVDLITFLFAFLTLLFFVPIPEQSKKQTKKDSPLAGCKEGVLFLSSHKGLLDIIVTMAVMNFFSRLTYENILSPMILARSGKNTAVLGVVTSILGIGGIIGGILVSLQKKKKDPIKMIYFSAAISFLFGDLLMGIGRNSVLWCIAGVFASVPIPFVMAGQRVILYKVVPEDMQGRVFSVRNAIQFSTIPIGIILGGFLAQYVFEPFMLCNNAVTNSLARIVGNGTGSGMAVMFLCTGILGSVTSISFYHRKEIQELRSLQ